RTDLGLGSREIDLHGEVHTLSPLGSRVPAELTWEQPKAFRREWTLMSDGGEHAVLHGGVLTRRHLRAETALATWVLTRSCVVEVKLADAEGRESVTIPHGWLGKARVELASGPTL